MDQGKHLKMYFEWMVGDIFYLLIPHCLLSKLMTFSRHEMYKTYLHTNNGIDKKEIVI